MAEVISHEPEKTFCAAGRRASGRVHLPVAPQALARVRFSPETPLPRALTPRQALDWLDYLAEDGEHIRVVNLNGPGDPLATPELTLQTLAALRRGRPELSICLTTLGYGAARVADELASYGLAHVSLMMDAVYPGAAERIYAWIRLGHRTLPLPEAARMLVAEQAQALPALVKAGLPVQVKTTVYPGVNSDEIGNIAQKAAELGAGEMKLFPFIAKDDNHPRPARQAEPDELEELSGVASKFLPAKFVDLAACREVVEFDFNDSGTAGKALPKPTKQRPNLAVCSSDGFEVDLHLGQAGQYLIYGPQDGPVLLLEARPAPEPGGGDTRWHQTALTLGDCFAVLCMAAGEAPKRVLSERGLEVVAQEGNVEGLVDALYGGGKKGKGGNGK